MVILAFKVPSVCQVIVRVTVINGQQKDQRLFRVLSVGMTGLRTSNELPLSMNGLAMQQNSNG